MVSAVSLRLVLTLAADARLEVIRAAIARFDASQKSQIAKAQEHIQVRIRNSVMSVPDNHSS